MYHTSHIITRRASHITHHTSHITRHTSHITHHTSHITLHTSHVTHHTSHITHHTSHITHHTSHITRHTSHVTRHTGPSTSAALMLPANSPPQTMSSEEFTAVTLQVWGLGFGVWVWGSCVAFCKAHEAPRFTPHVHVYYITHDAACIYGSPGGHVPSVSNRRQHDAVHPGRCVARHVTHHTCGT